MNTQGIQRRQRHTSITIACRLFSPHGQAFRYHRPTSLPDSVTYPLARVLLRRKFLACSHSAKARRGRWIGKRLEASQLGK